MKDKHLLIAVGAFSIQITEYDECMVRKYIEEIKVYEDKLTICFKTKVEIEVER